jgi:hypothetical protein
MDNADHSVMEHENLHEARGHATSVMRGVRYSMRWLGESHKGWVMVMHRWPERGSQTGRR